MTTPGEEYEAAAWFTGARGKRVAREAIETAFAQDAGELGVTWSAIEYSVLFPSDDRVPDPPAPGLRLMVGTARVVGVSPPEIKDIRRKGRQAWPVRSFYGDLDTKSADRLIRITRQAYADLNPGKPELSVEDCVKYIEMVGPDVWERELKAAVDEGRA